jgi:hypothetical protein
MLTSLFAVIRKNVYVTHLPSYSKTSKLHSSIPGASAIYRTILYQKTVVRYSGPMVSLKTPKELPVAPYGRFRRNPAAAAVGPE